MEIAANTASAKATNAQCLTTYAFAVAADATITVPVASAANHAISTVAPKRSTMRTCRPRNRRRERVST